MPQKTIERIISTCKGTVNFIDDILIYGSDDKEHSKRLTRVLEVLDENNILLKQQKCIFGASKIEFVGHELSSQGIKLLDGYVKVIKMFRAPKTVDEIQSFLGLVNYIGKWIPNLASATEPFRKLLRLKLGKHANIEKY